ncbi:MAG: hypothetical protein U5J64_06640 [Halobacteriales archaeon]|nr:hypothetical protein [Halobacteriales archaeon]
MPERATESKRKTDAVRVRTDDEDRMPRDEDEIREQEAGGAVFWAVVAVIGVALVVAGRLGYVDVSLDLFSVSITPELTGATLAVIGVLMVVVFALGDDREE